MTESIFLQPIIHILHWGVFAKTGENKLPDNFLISLIKFEEIPWDQKTCKKSIKAHKLYLVIVRRLQKVT